MSDRHKSSDEIPLRPGRPVYPEITRSQWAILSAMSDQRCENMMEAMDFICDLSPEAKVFLKKADKDTIEKLEANMDFYAASKTIWKFIWIGGGMFVAVLQAWKTFGDYITVKFK